MSTTLQKPVTSDPTKQFVLVLVFAGVFAGTILCSKFLSGPRAGEMDQPSRDAALSRYGFVLQEVSKLCGIDFKHESPAKLDPRLNHIMPIIASMGASVSVVDFDRDGWPDLYVVTSIEGGKNPLYRNMHDGTFEDV